MSTPKIKLKADPSLDLHAERDKLLRPIFKIRDLLLRREDHSLRLRYLDIKQKQIGLSKKNIGVKAYIRKHPNLFEIFEDPHTKEPWCRLSKAMEDLLEEEKRIYLGIEDEVVMKLRKILMMAKEKRIKAGKIDFARRTLGLPDDFATRVAPSYPHYFRVVGKSPSPFIELVAWDESIAFSEMEERARIDASKKKIDVKVEAPKKKVDAKIEVSKNDGFGFTDVETLDMGKGARGKGLDIENNAKIEPSKKNGFVFNEIETRGQPLAFKITHSPGMFLKRKNLELLERWQKLPYVSPYQDYSWVNPGTFISEKRVVGVLHEVLSLTLEKKALMQVLGRFRDEFGLPETIGKLVNRFPGIFYLSMRGNNKTVILREGYERESYYKSHLIDGDHPLVHLKYKYAQMVRDGPRIRASLREGAKLGSDDDDRVEEELCNMGEEMGSEFSDEESDVSNSDFIDSELDDDESCLDDDRVAINEYEREEGDVNPKKKAKPNKEIW